MFHRIELREKSLCGHVFCCKRCQKITNPFTGTFFERRRLSLVILFQMMSMFLLYVERKTTALLLKLDEHTVGQYVVLFLIVCYCRIHCLIFSVYHCDGVIFFVGQYYEEFASAIVSFYGSCSDHSIGGEGIVVEVDETKMGKRKYNKGHRVEGMLLVSFMFLFVPFVFISNAITLFFIDEVFGWSY